MIKVINTASEVNSRRYNKFIYTILDGVSIMKNILALCAITSLIGGLILTVVSGNLIMLGLAFGVNFVAIAISFLASKLVFVGSEEVEEDGEDYSSYRGAHSL